MLFIIGFFVSVAAHVASYKYKYIFIILGWLKSYFGPFIHIKFN